MAFASYIKSLLSVGICAFLCESIVTNKNLSRGMNLVTSLCIFTVVISPVLSFVLKGDIQDLFNTQKAEISSTESSVNFYTLVEDEMKKQISDGIFTEFGIPNAGVVIDLTVKENEPVIESVSVTVKKGYASQKEDIRNYLIRVFGNDTKITVAVTDE